MINKLNELGYYKWLVFLTTVIGTFMATLDGSIVNIALPTINIFFHSTIDEVQWVITAYLLVISSLLLVFAKIGDMFGRRILYSVGFFIFALGSLFCSFSTSLWILVGSRCIQAIGAAILLSNSYAIIMNTFKDNTRGRALGTVGAVVALGSITGPAIGGLLISYFSWESIFIINVPIGIIGVILSIIILPKQETLLKEKYDYTGSIILLIFIVSLLLFVDKGHDWGWLSFQTIIALIISIIFGLSFIKYEKKLDYPILDLELFKIKSFKVGNITCFISFICISSNIILLPFYMHRILHLTAGEMGILLSIFPITLAIIAPTSGYLSEKIEHRYLTTLGLLLIMSGLIYFSFLNEHSSNYHIVIAQIILGIGQGLFQSPNNNSILSSVPDIKIGIASGVNSLMRFLGMTVGAALSITIFETSKSLILNGTIHVKIINEITAFIGGYHIALISGAILALIAAILSFQRETNNSIEQKNLSTINS